MLDFHFFINGNSFGHKFEVILEKFSFEHSVYIVGQFFSFLDYQTSYVEAAFEVICDLCDIRNVIILYGLGILFGKLELNLISEEKLQVKLHYFLVLLQLKVVVQEHFHATAD